MKLVDVDPIIAAWKTVGVDKKNEAKPFLDSKNFIVYIQGQIRNTIGDVFLDLANVLENLSPSIYGLMPRKFCPKKKKKFS